MTADVVGGVWTYALDLAEGLGQRGFETSLALLGPEPRDEHRAAAAAIPSVTLIETGSPLDWTAAHARELREAGERLGGVARQVGADVVHLNSPALAAHARFDVPVVGVCHSCLATWWAAVKEGPPPEDLCWRIDALAEGYRACDLLTAPSAAFADLTLESHGLRPLVVRNGRRPALTVAAHEPVAICAGRLWDEGKGLAVLDVAAGLTNRPVFAAGPLESQWGRSPKLRHVRPLGSLSPSALSQRLAGARVFVSPALYEPFGLTVLEAAQAECALLLSDIPTFRELWDGAALFTPAGDAAALASAIDRLLDDAALAERLGRAARARSARYEVDAMVDGVIEAYGLAAMVKRGLAGAAA